MCGLWDSRVKRDEVRGVMMRQCLGGRVCEPLRWLNW